MKDGLLEQIRASGHWRVNFRPTGGSPDIKLTEFRELVRQSAVSIRGWDFPHFSFRNDDEGGSSNLGEYFENWTDWNGFKEFWRLYKSRQFIFYAALHDDMPQWSGGATPGVTLNTISTMYSVFEFVEFAHRLARAGLYTNGIVINLGIEHANGRHLIAGRNRMPFFDRYRFDGQSIKSENTIPSTGILQNHLKYSIDICLEIFDHFGWAPDRTQVEAEQRKFYEKNFGA